MLEIHVRHTFRNFVYGTCCSAVGWGTALQAGRLQFQLSIVSLEFVIDISFWLHYGPGFNSASNKHSWCVGLTTLPPSCANCLEIWKPQPPGQGLSRPVQGVLYLCLYVLHMVYSRILGTGILDFTVKTVLDDLLKKSLKFHSVYCPRLHYLAHEMSLQVQKKVV